MSLSDTDTTIVADLASAGQLITSLTSNLASLQALMGNVATTVMDPGTAVAGTMPCFLDTQPDAFPRNVQKLQSMPMFTTATTAVYNTAGLAANDPRRVQVQTAMMTSTVAIALTYARGAVQQYQARYNEKVQETADMMLTSMNADSDAMTKKIQSVTTMWDTIHTSTTSGRVEHTRRMCALSLHLCAQVDRSVLSQGHSGNHRARPTGIRTYQRRVDRSTPRSRRKSGASSLHRLRPRASWHARLHSIMALTMSLRDK